MGKFHFGTRVLAALVLLGGSSLAFAAPPPSVDLILSYKPKQPGIDISIPTAAETTACTVELEKGKGAATAWVLKDGQARILRKFHDTTGKGGVNMFAYFRDGEEVYREEDTGTGKITQFRWLGSLGSKIGIDSDADGKIDSWLAISPEEVSQEILAAIVTKDAKRFEALMLSKADLAKLALPAVEANRLQAKLALAGTQFQKTIADLAKLSPSTVWVHLETKGPQTIAADSIGAPNDYVRYRHGTILYQEGDGKDAKHNWLQTGELVQVDRAWRIVQAPVPGVNTGEQQPDNVAGNGQIRVPTGGDKFIEQMKDLDAKGPTKPGREGVVEYNLKRAALLEQIAALFTKAEEASAREVWVRQAIESYAAASQQLDESALKRLGLWRTAVAKDAAGSSLHAYIVFREMSGEYAQELPRVGREPAKLQKLQDTWRDQLAKFATDFPKGEDTPDALMQLGMLNEFVDKTADATKWYEKLVKDFPTHALGKKAQGCLTRLNLEGAPLVLTGQTLAGGAFSSQTLRGKAVVVYFWASWNSSAAADFTKIAQATSGFAGKVEIVAVNLDSKKEEADEFVKTNRVAGTHLYATGGQDGVLATQYGITVLPMMFVIGPDGKVVNRNAQPATLDDDLKKVLKDK